MLFAESDECVLRKILKKSPTKTLEEIKLSLLHMNVSAEKMSGLKMES